MAGRYELQNAERIRRNPWALAAPWALDALLLVVALVTWQPVVLVGLVHGTILGVVLTAFAWMRNPWPRRLRATLRADELGVWLGDQMIVARADIKQGLVYEHEGVFRVRLDKRRGVAEELAVPSEAEGRAFLAALDLDATQTVAQFRAMSPFFGAPAWKLFAGAMCALAGLGGIAGVLGAMFGRKAAIGAMVGCELLFLVLMLTLVIPARLSVGRDGILRRWLGRTKFIPLSSIESVAALQASGRLGRYVGAEVALKDGTLERLMVGQRKWNDSQAAMLVDRIDQVLAAHRSGGALPLEASALRRRGRDPAAWLASLRALGAGARDDLRSVPADIERLFRLIEDPTAPPVDRAAAAAALPPAVAAADRQRVRIAATATAEPRLRVALETVAAGDADDEALTELLSGLDAAAEAEEAALKRR